MIKRLLPEARIIQFLFPIHDTADTQRHSGNNLYLLMVITKGSKKKKKKKKDTLTCVDLTLPAYRV